MELLLGDFHVIERAGALARDLNFFVSFTGNQNDVAGTCTVDGKPDGDATVRLCQVWSVRTLQADESVIHDSERILAAGIVGSKDDKVASLPGSFAHQGALSAVA